MGEKVFAVFVLVFGAPFWLIGAVYEILYQAFIDGRRVVRKWGQG